MLLSRKHGVLREGVNQDVTVGTGRGRTPLTFNRMSPPLGLKAFFAVQVPRLGAVGYRIAPASRALLHKNRGPQNRRSALPR